MTSFDNRIADKFANVIRTKDDMHDYQDFAVDFAYNTPFSALFIDLGLGKTVISLTLLHRLLLEFGFNKALIIAPLRVATMTWPNEIPQWGHTATFNHHLIRCEGLLEEISKDVSIASAEYLAQERDDLLELGATKNDAKLHIAKVRKTAEYKDFVRKARIKSSRKHMQSDYDGSRASIHIVNRENVEWLVNSWGSKWPYDVVIIDESSCLKDHTTNRFKALKKVRPLMKRMLQLTATPAAETYLHLFAQVYLLDQGERLGKSFTAFRDKYFDFNRYTFEITLKPGAADEIIQKISDICLVMKAEDYLDLQRPIPVEQKVFLDPDQLALYEKLQNDLVVTLPDGTEIEAETAAALSQKLLQLASGVLYETVYEEQPDGEYKARRIVHEVHNHKIDKLTQLSEESGDEPLMVVYWHKSSLARLQKAFPHAEVMGKSNETLERWNKKQIPMLLVHPQSAGHGLNLQHGGHQIVFFDIPWSLELYLQVIGRLSRQGQTKAVVVHHIVAAETLDEFVVEALLRKEDAQLLLFRKLKEIRENLRKQPMLDTG